MFNLISIFAALFTVKEIIKEKTEKPAPKNMRFDWDAYWQDVRNGMSSVELIRKRQRGEYFTTKPKQEELSDIHMDAVIDVERYERDKSIFDEAIVENWREKGVYRKIEC